MSLIADRYELQDAVGHGGMASVHVARDRVLDRRVAMKLLRSDIGRDPVLRERFLREARLSAGLAHSNIVRVYDAGVDGDTPWIAMELIEGPSLREEMSRLGPMDPSRAVAIITQVLEGLGAAHRTGVVHRDVKPANVLLTGVEDPSAPSPDAKLGDFGIAKSIQGGGADLTQANQFMGTPKYIAPEVAIGMPASVQSDLYSAAIVLWEMLTGEPPFDHVNPLALAMMHRTDPVPSLLDLRPDVPAGLVRAIEKALAKEPEDRPGDAASMAETLAAGLLDRAMTPPAAAALAATAVLPTLTPPPPPPMPREQTVALDRPSAEQIARARPRPAAPPAAPARWGMAVLVALLLGLAVVAFVLTDSGQDAESPVQTPTPTTSTPTPTTLPTAVPVPATDPPPDPQPTQPDAPAPAATPNEAPTAEPVPEPTPEPTDPPAPTAPPPTAQPTPLIDLSSG